MEFEKDFITEHKLEDAQVTAITELVTGHIQGLKGEWDGKATKDADAILDGAAKAIQELTGHTPRDKGQKITDYMSKSWDHFSTAKSKEYDDKIAEYDTKIKDVKGNEALTKEYESAKEKIEALQKKEAEFDALTEAGFEGKYKELKESNNTLKIGNAFNSVKPNFPDTVNTYEAEAKWNTFKKEILDKNTIQDVDGVWMVVDKENEYKTTKLVDLVGKDSDLTALLEGRKQVGTGSKEATLKAFEGVPFKVPENATSIDRSKLIKDYLLEQGVSSTHPDYSNKFSAMLSKIKEGKIAA